MCLPMKLRTHVESSKKCESPVVDNNAYTLNKCVHTRVHFWNQSIYNLNTKYVDIEQLSTE